MIKNLVLAFLRDLIFLPLATYMTTYSCRTSEFMLIDLQKQVISHFRNKYPNFYQSDYINLDCNEIPHFGTESLLYKVWCGARGKALKGATLLAQDALRYCYSLCLRSYFAKK